MSHVFPRHTKLTLPYAVKGDGVYIIDSEGKQYLDASGGAAVSCLGHSYEPVVTAIKEQLDTIPYAHTGFFTSESAEKLADILTENAPEGLDRAYFVSGGSEATESALKLARQYHLERGNTKKYQIIARQQSYHGNTLGVLAAGGNKWRREPFEPMLMEMSHIIPCYSYREKRADETLDEYASRTAQALENEILKLGAENVAAFIAETVVGATLGAVPAEVGYFNRVREICDQYDVLLILDEVMCGTGRTGKFFAFETEGIVPDIVCMAKGLGAGYQPIGAMLCSSKIYEAIENGTEYFRHGHTYIGHPSATAAGYAVVSTLLNEDLINRCAKMGEKLVNALHEKFSQHSHIGDIRGRGLFLGLELVADRETKEPFEVGSKIHAKIKKAAFEQGLTCYPTAGMVDGKKGDQVLLAPPFIIEDSHINEITDKLEVAINNVLQIEGYGY